MLHHSLEAFVDDHTVYSKTWPDFLAQVRRYFELTRAVGGRLKGKKSLIGAARVNLLGYVVGADGISISPERKDELANLAAPTDVPGLQSLNGFLNYFKKFVPDYGTIADPLHAALKSQPFNFGPDCQAALDKLKTILTSDRVLHHIDYSKEIVFRGDASNKAIGGMLLMKDGADELPVAYFSQRLQGAQKNWSTTDQEAYAIFFGLVKFEHYLKGVNFVVETDHRNLVFISSSTVPRVVRWRERLYDYEFTVRHIPGKTNVVADTLSRLVTDDTDDEQKVCAVTEREEESSYQRSHNEDAQARARAAQLAEDGPSSDEDKHFLFQAVHNDRDGHYGINETMNRLKVAGITWPGLYDDIRAAVLSCPTCQKIKDKTKVKLGTYGSVEHDKPFEVVAIDTLYISDTDPYAKYVFVIIDVFTRWVELVPSVDKKGSSAAEALLTSWIARYGPPRVLLSDQGTEFLNAMMETLSNPFGITSKTTFGYHPEGNSVCERANQEILNALRGIAQPLSLYDQWASALPFVQFQLNTTTHRVLGTSPYSMVFGRLNQDLLPCLSDVKARLDESIQLGKCSSLEYAQELSAWISAGCEAAASHQDIALEKRLRELNHGRRTIDHKPGDLVLFLSPFCVDKLAPKLLGPFRIVEAVGTTGLLIENLEDLKRVTVSRRSVRGFKNPNLSESELVDLVWGVERLVLVKAHL